MVRMQIQLEEAHYHLLKELAARQRTSVAELIRQAVDRFLETSGIITQEERRRRASAIIGMFRSGKSDISVRHDEYLDEVYSEWSFSQTPLFHIHWITPEIHASAMSALLAARRRDVSLVDWTSFELMRRLGIRKAFTFDHHFAEQGFEVLPPA